MRTLSKHVKAMFSLVAMQVMAIVNLSRHFGVARSLMFVVAYFLAGLALGTFGMIQKVIELDVMSMIYLILSLSIIFSIAVCTYIAHCLIATSLPRVSFSHSQRLRFLSTLMCFHPIGWLVGVLLTSAFSSLI